jgi:hypothetical protein
VRRFRFVSAKNIFEKLTISFVKMKIPTKRWKATKKYAETAKRLYPYTETTVFNARKII